MIDGLFRLLLSPEVEPVNLGNPAERTIRDLVATLEAILGRALVVTYHPLPEDDPRVRQPDITRARQRLGWEPTVNLEAGLRQTIAYFQGTGDSRRNSRRGATQAVGSMDRRVCPDDHERAGGAPRASGAFSYGIGVAGRDASGEAG